MTTSNINIFRYFEFCEEAVRGTAETTPEMSCDVMSINAGIPESPDMEYKGSMGRGVRTHRPGFYSTKPKIEMGFDLKSLARMMYFSLGEQVNEVTEGAGTGVDPDRVFYYDASGDSFSNVATAFKSGTGTPIPGHASGEVGDYLAIGYDEQFTTVGIDVKTAKTDTGTAVWEYWDGDSWATLTCTDNTTGFTVSGANNVTFTAPADWGKTTLNNTKACYYVRYRSTVVTTPGTQGKAIGTVSTAPDTSSMYIYSSDNVLLPSFTGWFGVDSDAFVIPGLVMDKLEMKSEKEFMTLKCDMQGMGEEIDDLKTEDELTMNEDYPLAFYDLNVYMRQIGDETAWGSSNKISSEVKKFVFKNENGVKAAEGQAQGARFPYYIPASDRKISASFDYDYLTRKYYDLMQGGTYGPEEQQSSTEFEIMFEIDAGHYGTAQFYFPRCIVNSAPIEAKGRDFNTQGIEIQPYMDEITIPTTPEQTVYSDVLVTFTLNFADTSGTFNGPAWADE